MPDDTSEPEETKTTWWDRPWIRPEKIEELLNYLRSSNPYLPGVPLSDAFQKFVQLKIEDAYQRGLANPNGDGRWINSRLFEIAVQLSFVDLLKNGTLVAFGQNGSMEWNPPRGYWTFIEIKDIDFKRSIFFRSDSARAVYGVMIAPAADAPKKKPGPKCTIKDKVATKMRQYAKEHGLDELRTIKVALLPTEFGGTTAYEAWKLVLSELSESLKG